MPSNPREVLTRKAPAPTRTRRYGPAGHELYDVYTPQRQTGGDLVVIHGGFWRSGYDRTHLYPLATALREAGHRVFLPEYRGTGADGGGWPATFDDIAVAHRAITFHDNLDAHTLAGHSAGGHLALWLTHQPDQQLPERVVSLAGCLDLRLVDELGLGDGAARALLGAPASEVPDLIARVDPAVLGPGPVPVLALHGVDDVNVPQQVTRSWWQAAGVPGRDEVRMLPECEHFGLIDPLHPAHAEVLSALRGWTV